ncbi:uncharacterized protein F4807DRAFT_408030 [Annulohypoxylon truncatum]|uniref:uncharacterized protein n=1 Tax=Annulohypoxylon truncatum TaxID=327061 RepID=UPI002007AE96|nr:uncharacterized protein F4807DRAFT_408030 [Annulohypoxylon truncatum]KAI1214422.1 hypothetical protein F4807DRAFT_408030 [Annulohypoxylon truncatum]
MMENQQVDGQHGSLVSAIEKTGLKAFQPSSDEASRLEGQREFSALLSRTKTVALMSSLTKLTQPDRVPGWLRIHLMDVLTLLPQRPDGVRAALEFVFSVHPSSTVRISEAATPQKRGANITMEALKLASNLLSAPPTTVSPDQWYTGIAPQLLALLDGKEGPDLVKAAAYVIGFGVLGRKQFGAPGTPGWKAFAEPLLTKINTNLSQEPKAEPLVFSAGPDEVVDLRKEVVLVRPDELYTALKRLSSLLDSHPNPGLTKRLLSPLMSSLWTISTWPPTTKEFDERYRYPATTLLRIYLKLSGSPEKFQALLDNLLANGSVDASKPRWIYDLVGDSNLQVKRLRGDANAVDLVSNLGLLESKSDDFVELLQSVGTDSDISALFLNLLRSSLGPAETVHEIKIIPEAEPTKDPTIQLTQAKVLQKMMEKEALSDKLVTGWKQVLELVSQFLDRSQSSSTAANDDTTSLALSLLNLVVTAPGFQKSNAPTDIIESIEKSLEGISKSQDTDVSQTARNLSLLLKYRDSLDDPSEQTTAPTDRQIEDRKTYNLAISYITQADSPPPVRTEGLNLLSGLIRASSPILDIQATLVLLSSLLNEDDDYINLTVVRLFAQLADKHPRSTTKEILDHYVDANEQETTDARLRFGEALLQVIQRLGETFSGEIAKQVGEALLSIAGRRAHRPKTKAKQERQERLQQLKNKAARDAWQGEVPTLADSDDEESQTEEERARNEIIAQIVSGWDSKRGAEDIRMRASALSLFSAGIETNISGLGAPLVQNAVDLCLNALALESGPETGILRRAAIVLILHVVRALADARESGKRSLGFALAEQSRAEIARALEYVAQTDTDGLVREHARDVVESLHNWRLSALVPAASEVRGDGPAALTRLAGLDIGVDARPSLPALEPGVRPRIEEVE